MWSWRLSRPDLLLLSDLSREVLPVGVQMVRGVFVAVAVAAAEAHALSDRALPGLIIRFEGRVSLKESAGANRGLMAAMIWVDLH